MREYRFGRESREALETCHPTLRSILRFAIKFIDFKVLECHRTEARQNQLFEQGLTKVRWPDSRHNSLPSLAVDFAPYPIDWSDTDRFYYTAGIIMGVGELFLYVTGLNRKYRLRYGGDWDKDGDVREQSFKDLGHIELIPLED